MHFYRFINPRMNLILNKLNLFDSIMTIFLINVLIGINACSPNAARNQNKYFVHSTGYDNNRGTIKQPFKTIQVLKSIEFNPGDSIFLQADWTFAGTLELKLEGTPEKPIVISSYGDGKAVLNGGDREAIRISGNWFQIAKLDLLGSGRKSGNTTSGLVLHDASHVVVDEVKTSGFQKCGILVQNSLDVTVKNVHAIHNGAIGISVTNSKNCVINDCLAENNPGDPTNLTNHSGNGILVGESKNILIDHCVATNNGWDMPRIGNGPVGIWAYQTDSIVIQYCIAYRNKTSQGAKDGGGFDFDGGVTNSIIQYCLSYENQGAGYGLFQYPGADPWANNIIRYNLSINDGLVTDGAGGIFVWNGGEGAFEVSDCYIHNNVIYNELKPAIVFEPASEHVNFNFNNNIFIGSVNIVEGPTSGDKFLGNIWWNAENCNIAFRGYESLNKWANATGQEKSHGKIAGLQIDPLLIGPMNATVVDPKNLHLLHGFKLNDKSPVKNRGVNVKELLNIVLPDHDFFGNSIIQGASIEPGIFEIEE
jgi:parallel beta-helix repeat protein